jgi:hypothetical protein
MGARLWPESCEKSRRLFGRRSIDTALYHGMRSRVNIHIGS